MTSFLLRILKMFQQNCIIDLRYAKILLCPYKVSIFFLSSIKYVLYKNVFLCWSLAEIWEEIHCTYDNITISNIATI
jgi:hypothetical protein